MVGCMRKEVGRQCVVQALSLAAHGRRIGSVYNEEAAHTDLVTIDILLTVLRVQQF